MSHELCGEDLHKTLTHFNGVCEDPIPHWSAWKLWLNPSLSEACPQQWIVYRLG